MIQLIIGPQYQVKLFNGWNSENQIVLDPEAAVFSFSGVK
jgi:hypothetical protein